LAEGRKGQGCVWAGPMREREGREKKGEKGEAGHRLGLVR